MKKRLLAAMLGASLAISSTPAQAGLTTYIFRNWVLPKATADQAEKASETYEKIDKVERIVLLLGLASGAYFGLDHLLKTSTKENISFLELLLGIGGVFGVKCASLQEKIDKGAQFWRNKWGVGDEDKYDAAAESVKNGFNQAASAAKNSANAIGKGLSSAAKAATVFFGADADDKNKGDDSSNNNNNADTDAASSEEAKPEPAAQPNQQPNDAPKSDEGWTSWVKNWWNKL